MGYDLCCAASIALESRSGGWRLTGQWKLDEAFQGAHGSPALALHQINNVWTVAQFGNYVMPSLPAFTNQWTYFATDITFSTDPREVKSSFTLIRNLDGVYEESTPIGPDRP